MDFLMILSNNFHIRDLKMDSNQRIYTVNININSLQCDGFSNKIFDHPWKCNEFLNNNLMKI